MIYASIIKIEDEISDKKDLQKIILCDLQKQIYPKYHRTGIPENQEAKDAITAAFEQREKGKIRFVLSTHASKPPSDVGVPCASGCITLEIARPNDALVELFLFSDSSASLSISSYEGRTSSSSAWLTILNDAPCVTND